MSNDELYVEAEVRAEKLPTAYLECRSLGHAWSIRWWGSIDELPEDLVPPIARAFRWLRVRVSICLRCETVRDEFFPVPDIIRPDHEIDPFRCEYRRYRYANDYQLKGVGEAPPRSLFNRVAYARWVVGDPEFHS